VKPKKDVINDEGEIINEDTMPKKKKFKHYHDENWVNCDLAGIECELKRLVH